MKKLFLVVLMLSSLSIRAQQERNPKLALLKNEKDTAVLQLKLKALQNGSEEDMLLLKDYYGRDPKARAVGENILKKFPKGTYAFTLFQNDLGHGSSVAQQEEMLAKAKKEYRSANFDMPYLIMALSYTTNKNTPKAIFYFNEIKDPTFRLFSTNKIVAAMMKYDVTAAAKLIEEELPRAKLIGGTNYYTAINLYGQLLVQAEKYAEALPYVKEAYENVAKKDDALIQNYGYLLSINGKYSEALPLLEKIMIKGKGSDKVREQLKKAYQNLNAGKDVDLYIKSLDNQFKAEVGEKVSKLSTNLAAPDFVVKDVNGKTRSLADFKGKTIIVDFWATWCEPCKASFPAMQMAVNKYKNDPNVKFLFIHTWETVADPFTAANTFLNSNNFKLDLYMDMKDPLTKTNPAVTAFGVTGIPAKFVIDGSGKIRFKLVGFSGSNEAAVEELSQMIDLARKDI
jgi:thiol-disulfide isomerase/thioredoxin